MRGDTEHLRRAIALAVASARGGGGPFGAVIVRAGEVVGEGANRVVPDGDPTAHAEVVALRAASRRLGTHVLDRCTVFASCEPCPMCLGALWWARVERVVFAAGRGDAAAAGFDDEELYAELGRPPGARRLPLVPLLRDEGLAAFIAWAENERRTPY